MAAVSLKLARLHGGPEIFHSIQGEGVSQGVPSVFIRASLCNLHCHWCDTDYTWNWQGTPWPHDRDAEPGYQKFKKEDHIVKIPTSEVAEIVTAIPCRNIILTGGEPLLQDNSWLNLMQQLRDHDPAYRFEIETNGTIAPSEAFNAMVTQYNISPKLANSGNDAPLRLKKPAMSFFAKSTKAWFKFVIAEETDLEEVKEIIQRYQLPKTRILLMPEGRDDTALQRRRLWLADLCRDQDYRYSDRLHIQLWGSKQGV